MGVDIEGPVKMLPGLPVIIAGLGGGMGGDERLEELIQELAA